MAPMVEINGEPSHQVRSATTAAQFRRSLFRSADHGEAPAIWRDPEDRQDLRGVLGGVTARRQHQPANIWTMNS